ncbi:MAG: translation initiation factor [Chitinophagia bacterium]|nr:translation initiation factor [Chitinophagia bacterium]
MKKKNRLTGNGIVYSTDPSFSPEPEEQAIDTLSPGEQLLRISLDKKQRAGKVVTLITGFIGRDSDMEDLGKQLRNYCGTGGSAKDGIMLVQGDQREKVMQFLNKQGYSKAKKIG